MAMSRDEQAVEERETRRKMTPRVQTCIGVGGSANSHREKAGAGQVLRVCTSGVVLSHEKPGIILRPPRGAVTGSRASQHRAERKLGVLGICQA